MAICCMKKYLAYNKDRHLTKIFFKYINIFGKEVSLSLSLVRHLNIQLKCIHQRGLTALCF